MKVSKFAGSWGLMFGVLLAGSFLAGCRAGSGGEPQFARIPGVGEPPPTTGTVSTASAPGSLSPSTFTRSNSFDRIHVGDTLLINFSDLPYRQEPIEDRVRGDGTIMLIQNLTFKAAETDRAELEKEIHDAYVPKYFKTMTVQVTPQRNTQFYYVDGEVKRPDRQVYIGRITVLKAIASASGFTDFAHRSAVVLTRADGQTVTINTVKAQRNPKLDLEIYPGDKIYVPRKVNPFSR